MAQVLVACSGDKEEPKALSEASVDKITNPQTVSSKALENKNIDICFFDWKPVAYMDNGKPTGSMIELARDVVERAGYLANFHPMPVMRCINELQNQRVTLGLFLSPLSLQSVGKDLLAIEPVVQYQLHTIVVPIDHPAISYGGLQSLDGWTIGAIRGHSFVRTYQDELPNVEWVLVNQTDALPKMLATGRIDAVLGDYLSVVLVEPEMQKRFRYLLPSVNTEPLYWAVHKSHEALAEQLSIELQRAVDDGAVDKYYRKHLGVSFKEVGDMAEHDN